MMQNLEIFKSLFKGWEDVFAIRWERDSKSGYFTRVVHDYSDVNKGFVVWKRALEEKLI